MNACPCCSGRAFSDCCEPYLEGWESPPTALALMRSRYSAYATGAIDYIEATSGGSALLEFSRADATAWAKSATFTRLEVLASEAGAAGDERGIVEFAATFVEQGKVQVLRERSRFARDGGSWRYVGREPATKKAPK